MMSFGHDNPNKLAAALGGYISGIIVGFLTNLINGIWDYIRIS